MNKTLEMILQAGMDDFKFITENDLPNLSGKKLMLKEYIDYDLSALEEIIDESKDDQLVEQCKLYLEVASSRPNKWDDVNKTLAEREGRSKKEPKDVEEALALYNAADDFFAEVVKPIPVQLPLSTLVDLYIVPETSKINPEFLAFNDLEDVHGRTDFYMCNHIALGTPVVYKKDDFFICAICGKTVSAKKVEEYVKHIESAKDILGGN